MWTLAVATRPSGKTCTKILFLEPKACSLVDVPAGAWSGAGV